MEIKDVKAVKAIYKAQPRKYKEVRYYEVVTPLEDDILKPIVNISKNREFNKSQNVAYWYRNKGNNDKKLSRCITGLKRTNNSKIYYGDIAERINGRFIPKHFILFCFSDDMEQLKIEVYKNYYPDDVKKILKLI